MPRKTAPVTPALGAEHHLGEDEGRGRLDPRDGAGLLEQRGHSAIVSPPEPRITTWELVPRIFLRRSSSKPLMTPMTMIRAITPRVMPQTEM